MSLDNAELDAHGAGVNPVQFPAGVQTLQMAWAFAFGLSTLAFYALMPSIALSLVFIVLLSLTLVIGAAHCPERLTTTPRLYGAIGGTQTAAILWVAISAAIMTDVGHGTAAMILSVLMVPAIFIAMLLVEAVFSALAQFAIAEEKDPAISTASLIEAKYAGLLGRTI